MEDARNKSFAYEAPAKAPEHNEENVTDGSESCGERWVQFGATVLIQILVPIITVLHIYALSNRQAYTPDCEEQFFLGLPSLASGTLLCCLLCMFVTQLTSTAKDYYVASLYFTSVCAVYIFCCGGLFTAFSKSSDWYKAESISCRTDPYFTTFLLGSMYMEFLVVCGCVCYIFVQVWHPTGSGLIRLIPRSVTIPILVYTAGFLLVQFSAPVFLQANTFRFLFFVSPSSHIDFVLDTVCIYLCIVNAETARGDFRTLYTIIVVESAILKWPSFFLDFTFLDLSSTDCSTTSDSLECAYMTPLWIGIVLKFVGLQLLGSAQLEEVLSPKCKGRSKEPDEKATPLLKNHGEMLV